MIFWDSSAITPLLITEMDSDLREDQLRQDPAPVVWYETIAEIESALNRRRRDGSLSRDAEKNARGRLELLEHSWIEVQPTVTVRERAIRLLRTHPLRAADAFQLAAGLVICDEKTRGFRFFTADQRLSEAAEAEGFSVA